MSKAREVGKGNQQKALQFLQIVGSCHIVNKEVSSTCTMAMVSPLFFSLLPNKSSSLLAGLLQQSIPGFPIFFLSPLQAILDQSNSREIYNKQLLHAWHIFKQPFQTPSQRFLVRNSFKNTLELIFKEKDLKGWSVYQIHLQRIYEQECVYVCVCVCVCVYTPLDENLTLVFFSEEDKNIFNHLEDCSNKSL